MSEWRATITRWLRIGFPPSDPVETFCITGTVSQIHALRQAIGSIPGLEERPPEMQLVIAWSAIKQAMEKAGLTVTEAEK